ncbi:hypothetical protein IWW36_004057 [Coemansia brasiliensis]|uniref:HNH domain-containing protein n=1 Tax=Coemansia brasiliensis TaxID=2650707 RepID=A0A9W8LZF0_9FUNG|nr:hypothetical protein IWW36_004057 [Coemansia brasiliensis]
MTGCAAQDTCALRSPPEQQTPVRSISTSVQRRATPRSTARQIVPVEEQCWPVTKLLEKYPELRYERWLPSTLRGALRNMGAVFDERVQRGEKGNALCLWCGRECSSSDALFCSGTTRQRIGEGCEHEHRMRRDGQYVRRQLFVRDRGVCARCGIDAHALFQQATACQTLEQRRKLFRRLARQVSAQWQTKARRALESMDVDFTSGMMWEAAHVIDVRHGGGLCGLDGFYTLCTPCHNDDYIRNYAQDLCDLQLSPTPTRAHRMLTARSPSNPRPPVLLESSPSSPSSSSSSSPLPDHALRPARHCAAAETPKKTRAPANALNSAKAPLALASTPTKGLSSASAPAKSLTSASAPAKGSALSTPTKALTSAKKSAKMLTVSKSPTKALALTPTKTPVRRPVAIIDLTGPPTLILPIAASREVDQLADDVATFNISSEEESSEDEVQVVSETSKLPAQ